MLNRPRLPCSRILAPLAVLAGLLTGLSACGTTPPAVPAPPEISAAQARTELAGGALLVDVREPSEYSAGHIPGAITLPLGDLAARLSELPRDRLIITICRSGVRSAQARDLLLQNGFPRVTSLAGGIQAWQAAGYFLQGG
jgi:rhodanese-related sulfurtransferase